MLTVFDLIEELKEYPAETPLAIWDELEECPSSLIGKLSFCQVMYRVQGVEVPIQHVLIE